MKRHLCGLLSIILTHMVCFILRQRTVRVKYKTFTSRCLQQLYNVLTLITHKRAETPVVLQCQDHPMCISKAWIRSCSIFMLARRSR